MQDQKEILIKKITKLYTILKPVKLITYTI